MDVNTLLQIPDNAKIALLGLGKENTQFLEWLIEVIEFPANRIILLDGKDIDLSQNDRLKHVWHTLLTQANFGSDYLESLQNSQIEYIFKSPGFWSLHPSLVEFRERKGGDRVLTGLVFFITKFREQIIGITGTKGKSTTSSLTDHLINELGKDGGLSAVYCGNTTGISPYQYWTLKNQIVDPKQFFVIELSSFQLQDLAYSKISPKYCAITNYYIDHLDQHRDVIEYWRAKDGIFQFQKPDDTAILNHQIASHTEHKPNLEGKIVVQDEDVLELGNYLLHNLAGQHNQANVTLASLVSASVFSHSNHKSDLLHYIKNKHHDYSQALRVYQPLPHRQQLIWSQKHQARLHSIDHHFHLVLNFIDDGFATEPEAVIASITTFTERSNQFLWLFMCGVDKGPDLENLVKTLDFKNQIGRIYKLEACGKIGKRTSQSLKSLFNTTEDFADIKNFKQTAETALNSLSEIVHEFESWFEKKLLELKNTSPDRYLDLLNNDKIELNIVLSPGGSSFDEFNNATERAQWWSNKVEQIAKI